MSKKITLFWFNTPTIGYRNSNSLTIAYLAQTLQEHNLDVTSIDGNQIISFDQMSINPKYCFKKLIYTTEKTNPDILAVGSWSVNFPFVLEFTKAFKKRNPNVLIIIGGYNPTFMPKFILDKFPHIDILVRGEGECTLLELIQKINRGEDWRSVKGLAYRESNHVKITPSREPIKDLDKLPFLDFSSFSFVRKMPSIMLFTSRGCPFGCNYCSQKSFWSTFRQNSASYVLKQIKILYDKFSLKSVGFGDDNFLFDKKRFFKIMKGIIEIDPEMHVNYQARIDNLSPDLISKIYNSKPKTRHLYIGIESILPESLKFFKKTNDPKGYLDAVYKNIDALSKTDIICTISTIIGYPYETKEDIMKMAEFISSLRKVPHFKVQSGFLTPYVGSDIWQKYLNSEVEIFKIKNPRVRRNFSGVFSHKYEHIVEFVPNSYAVKNKTMDTESYEELMAYIRLGVKSS